MDDEAATFAKLLSQSAAPAQPSWSAPAEDPWANPFSDAASNPFAETSASPFAAPSSSIPTPTFGAPGTQTGHFGVPDSPREEISPYVQQLARDADEGRGVLPDPPSVIAAREAEANPTATASPRTNTHTDPYTTFNGGYQSQTSPAPYEDFGAQRHGQIQNGIAADHDPYTQRQRQATPPQPSKDLPPGLIDEDLLAENDPSASLKKAFVKSSASPAKPKSGHENHGAAKVSRYVFRPSPHVDHTDKAKGKAKPEGQATHPEAKLAQPQEEKKQTPVKVTPTPAKDTQSQETDTQSQETDTQSQEASKQHHDNSVTSGPGTGQKQEASAAKAVPADVKVEVDNATPPAAERTNLADGEPESAAVDASTKPDTPDTPVATTSLAPDAIPLPTSSDVTPIATRSATPVPPALHPSTAPRPRPGPESEPEPAQPTPSTVAATPIGDRVAVSPLDPPSVESDYGFKSLAIGAASASVTRPPPPPTKDNNDGWGGAANTPAPPASRFAGKGWGAVDDDDDANGGLFGKGGPLVKADPWGGGQDSGGWGEPGISSTPASAGPSYTSTTASSTTTPSRDTETLPPVEAAAEEPRSKSKPMFQISVGDPTRIGDPVRGYTVYTVRTRTTSPHYRKNEFSVLRRFSDFLWLFDALTLNNPGVIVPPVPDKHPFGRFQDQFIETRRLALERCLNKVTSHPVLQLDLDLRLFLESDSFAIESKNRRLETPTDKSGLLAGWTGPKFVEQDDWFDSRRTFLDSLESQLKSLSKSIEGASKTRLDLGVAMGDVADSMGQLAESDLGTAMCAALARLADLARHERETAEEQAKSDVVHILNLADEYVRFIASVRLAFASRIKSYHAAQAAEKEVGRLKAQREKLRQQGKLGDRAQQSLVEVSEAERRAREASAEFDQVSRLVKSEFARFERERVQEFKRVLETHLAEQIKKQKELIDAWEEYHGVVLKMVQKSQQGQGQEPQSVRA